jgi:hypothetical protein
VSFFLTGLLKPKSLPHQGPDQISVVPSPHEELERSWVVFDVQRSVDSVGAVEEKQKLTIFIYLLGYYVFAAGKFEFTGRSAFYLLFTHL